MKKSMTRLLTIDLVMDSSEAILFNKGGKQNIALKGLGGEPSGNFDDLNFDFFDQVVVTVQMGEQARFNWVTGEAAKAHRRREEGEKKP